MSLQDISLATIVYTSIAFKVKNPKRLLPKISNLSDTRRKNVFSNLLWFYSLPSLSFCAS